MAPFKTYPTSFTPRPDDPQYPRSNEWHAYNACCTNDISTLTQLLKDRRIRTRDKKDPVTVNSLLLHAAAANAAIDCLKKLLREGWRVNDSIEVPQDGVQTPLREAAKAGCIQAINTLLERGAKPTIEVFREACIAKTDGFDQREAGPDTEQILRRLVEVLLEDRDGVNADLAVDVWYLAASRSHLALAASTLPYVSATRKYYVSTTTIVRSYPVVGDSTVPSTASSDPIFDLVLNANIYGGWSDEWYALNHCAMTRQMPRALRLIQHLYGDSEDELPGVTSAPLCDGPDSERAKDLEQLLIHAVEGDNTDLIDILIRRGISPNWQSYCGLTAIHHAARSQKAAPETLERLLATDAGGDAQLQAIEYIEDDDQLNEYQGWEVEDGLSSQLVKGNTPLHVLVQAHNVNTEVLEKRARLLLAAGANVNARNRKRETPLALALKFVETRAQQPLIEVFERAGGRS